MKKEDLGKVFIYLEGSTEVNIFIQYYLFSLGFCWHSDLNSRPELKNYKSNIAVEGGIGSSSDKHLLLLASFKEITLFDIFKDKTKDLKLLELISDLCKSRNKDNILIADELVKKLDVYANLVENR